MLEARKCDARGKASRAGGTSKSKKARVLDLNLFIASTRPQDESRSL